MNWFIQNVYFDYSYCKLFLHFTWFPVPCVLKWIVEKVKFSDLVALVCVHMIVTLWRASWCYLFPPKFCRLFGLLLCFCSVPWFCFVPQHHCECQQGYEDYQPGAGCGLIDMCSSDATPPPCPDHSQCETVEPGRAGCRCLPGYLGDGQTCYGNIMQVRRSIQFISKVTTEEEK